MARLSDINSTIARRISLPELGVRGSYRVAQTIAAVSPRALRWGLRRQRPPAGELRELFEALGATYIKFGQFIASSPSLFPREYVEEFQTLLDQTQPISFNTVCRIIEEDLGEPVEAVFARIDPRPLASASIAQVHAATLPHGEDVVVKVQKPGVQAVITVDLHTVFVLVRLLEFMLPNTDRDALTDIVSEMYQAMIDECDFRKEAEHLTGFREFLQQQGVTEVVAPRPYPQASGPRVLTMERFYGGSLTDPEALAKERGTHAEALFSALNVWFASLVNCDFFHADLHSGNMLLLDDGRVGFIDFGMVGRVAEGAWESLFSLVRGLGEADHRVVAASMVRVGMTRAEVDLDALSHDIAAVFAAMESLEAVPMGMQGADAGGVDALLGRLGEVARTHGIRFPRSFTLVIKQFLYFDRYLQILDPGAQLFDDDRIVMHV